jgi:hypothetical protein
MPVFRFNAAVYLKFYKTLLSGSKLIMGGKIPGRISIKSKRQAIKTVLDGDFCGIHVHLLADKLSAKALSPLQTLSV